MSDPTESPTGLVIAGALVVLAGVFSAADAALTSYSRARAEELVGEGRAGAKRLVTLLDDRAPYLNTAILLRLLCETGAAVLLTLVVLRWYDGSVWPTLATSVAAMTLLLFVVVGVAPRTLGRQQADRVAPVAAVILTFATRILGPIPQLLILIGNAITPGRGFRSGPFSTETELRELVDYAEASSVIESGERAMIHSVFEFGDTIAREVMVPRGDVVYIERYKNLRQTLSLFLRSGFSRVPVIQANLDDIVGFAYLKDVVRRDFDDPDVEFTQRVDEVMRPALYVPESKPVDDDRTAHRRFVEPASTSRSSSTSTAARPGWSRSRTCSRRSSARSPTSTTRTRSRPSRSPTGRSGSPRGSRSTISTSCSASTSRTRTSTPCSG